MSENNLIRFWMGGWISGILDYNLWKTSCLPCHYLKPLYTVQSWKNGKTIWQIIPESNEKNDLIGKNFNLI